MQGTGKSPRQIRDRLLRQGPLSLPRDHLRVAQPRPHPWVIVGVFPPPIQNQLKLL